MVRDQRSVLLGFVAPRASNEREQSSEDQGHPGDIRCCVKTSSAPPLFHAWQVALMLTSLCWWLSLQHYRLFSLCLSLLSVSLVVEDPLSVSDCTSLPAGLISDQRPVSISYVCWYRMQSLSFYDILQSNEVTANEGVRL